VFPFLGKKLDFSHELEQHKVIHGKLEALLALIHDARASPSIFDAQMMKKMMLELKEPLVSQMLALLCRQEADYHDPITTIVSAFGRGGDSHHGFTVESVRRERIEDSRD